MIISMNAITRLALLLLLVPAALVLAQDKKKLPPKEVPKVLMALPFGVKPGAAAKVILRGLKLESVKEVRIAPAGTVKLLKKGKVAIPAQMEAGKVGDSEVEVEMTIPTSTPGDAVKVVTVGPDGESTPHAVLIDRSPPIAEKEPNDGSKQAQAVKVGQVVEGTIFRPLDVDLFRFEGKVGQKVVVEVHAARHGSPLDSVLTLYDGSGAILDTSDDIPGSTDSRIEATLPKAGTYYAALSDAHDQGAAFFLYRLAIREK
jgi:hypothetical protein